MQIEKRKFVSSVLKGLVALTSAAILSSSTFAAEKASDRKVVVGFSQIGAESAWRTANTESIMGEAKKRPNFEIKFSDAQQKQENQIKAIRSFITQGVDVIAFAPVVETGWEPVLKEAKRAGIPVILTDRSVDVKDDSLYVTVIASDFVDEGRKAANFLVKELGGKGRIVELQGTVGSAPANDRKAGFQDVVSKEPGLQIIKSQSADFTRSKGKEVMEAFLKAHGKDINALYAHNDDMAIGAIQAIEAYGLKPGKDIKIVSIDGVRGAFEAMAAGKLNATVECNPLLGPVLFDTIENLRAGKPIPKRIVVKDEVYTQDVAQRELPNRLY